MRSTSARARPYMYSSRCLPHHRTLHEYVSSMDTYPPWIPCPQAVAFLILVSAITAAVDPPGRLRRILTSSPYARLPPPSLRAREPHNGRWVYPWLPAQYMHSICTVYALTVYAQYAAHVRGRRAWPVRHLSVCARVPVAKELIDVLFGHFQPQGRHCLMEFRTRDLTIPVRIPRAELPRAAR